MASYVYGSAVRKEKPVSPQPVKKQKKKVSQRVRKNRRQALHMNRGYVMFLAAASVAVLFACVQYLRLQAEVTSRSENIIALQYELESMREANTTKYNAVMNFMNLEEIRDKAMNELGMVYADTGQVIKYSSPTSNSVTQHMDIPESGIAASLNVAE